MNFDVQINERGQITIPKEVRDTVNIKAHDRLKIKVATNGQIMLYKPDFFDDVEDLIRKDLVSEGLSTYQIEKMIPERKKALGNALIKMASEVNDEIFRGEYVTLDQLRKESEDKD